MNKDKMYIGKASKYLGFSIDTLRRWDKSNKLSAERSPGGHRIYSKFQLDLYKQDIFALATGWVLSAPHEPSKNFYCQFSSTFKHRLFKLESTLKKREDLQQHYQLIGAVTGEIGNNSFDHNLGNWPDISGTFFAFDSNKKQIVLADRGVGLFKTLKRVKPGIRNDVEALHTAFTEVISGGAPEARGNGLRFVREVILNNPLHLEFIVVTLK